LNYAVKVTQGIEPNIGIWLVDATSGNEIQDLLFSSAADVQPAARSFYLRWAPAKVAVDATMTTAIGDTPFKYATSGSDTPGVAPMTSIGGSTGEYLLTIQPAAFTETEIKEDPFAEKISKVEFTITSGGTTVSRSLYLRQANFLTVADVTTGYLLDGAVHSFTVRSNSEWVIDPASFSDPAGVMEPTSKSAFLAQSGGYDTDPGTAFTFQLINTNLITAGGEITFTLVDPTRRAANVPVTIVASNCGWNGFAVPRQIGGNVYLTHRYGNKCWMVDNSREGNPSYTHHNNAPDGVVNGYYYSFSNRATACPSGEGWTLPVRADVEAMIADLGDHNNTRAVWWGGSLVDKTKAYAGAYAGGSTNVWYEWETGGRWWALNTDVYYLSVKDANNNKIYIGGVPSGTNYFTIRCVHDL
jgi:uncharacterized protein (TIGR02145 family)